MADFPALPLWTDAYLGDTRHLTRDAHGAYLLLLIEAWRRPRCSLPDDDNLLAKLTCSTLEEWKSLKPIVMAFWKLDGRRREWTQKRLLKEHNYVAEVRSKNRDAALTRWNRSPQNPDSGKLDEKGPVDNPFSNVHSRASRSKQTKTEHANAYANAMPPHPHPLKKEGDARGKKKAGVCPDASAPKPAIERLFRTMRSEIGEAAFKTWLQPLEVVDQPNGALTFRAPTRCHRDWVASRYVSRMETIAGAMVEIVVAGAAPIERPPAAPPPPPKDHPDRPDFSQILQQMPPGDPDNGTGNRQPPALPPPPPARPASTRRKVSGFTAAEVEAGALDAPWPAQPPPDKPPAAE